MKSLPDQTKLNIRKMYAEGYAVKSIAATLNVSHGVVSKYTNATRRGHYLCWNKQNQILCDYRSKGKPYHKIANKLNCTANAVKIAMHRYRKKMRADPAKRLVAELLMRALFAGATPGQAIRRVRDSDIIGRVPYV